MSEGRSDDDRILTRILQPIDVADEAGAGEASHQGPDDELLVLFVAGVLSQTERNAVIEHLADCARCRRSVSQLMILWEPSTPAILAPAKGPRRRGWLPAALAAAVLIGVAGVWGISQFPRAGSWSEDHLYAQAAALLENRRFIDAERLLAEARRRGVESPRLRNLEYQSMLKQPGPIALAYAGKLSDYGVEIGGAEARGRTSDSGRLIAEQGLALWAGTTVGDERSLLNQGHALLVLERPKEALAAFQKATAEAPADPLAWLGKGLACFLLENYAEAEAAFREALRLSPEDKAARFNLAMALQEQGRRAEAIEQWRRVLRQSSSKVERDEIQRELKLLGEGNPP